MNRASIRPHGLVARVGEVGCVVRRLEAPMKDPMLVSKSEVVRFVVELTALYNPFHPVPTKCCANICIRTGGASFGLSVATQ